MFDLLNLLGTQVKRQNKVRNAVISTWKFVLPGNTSDNITLGRTSTLIFSASGKVRTKSHASPELSCSKRYFRNPHFGGVHPLALEYTWVYDPSEVVR